MDDTRGPGPFGRRKETENEKEAQMKRISACNVYAQYWPKWRHCGRRMRKSVTVNKRLIGFQDLPALVFFSGRRGTKGPAATGGCSVFRTLSMEDLRYVAKID